VTLHLPYVVPLIGQMLKSIGSPFAPKAVLPASRVQPYSDKQRIRWKD